MPQQVSAALSATLTVILGVAVFAGFWIGVSFLISVMSGWRRFVEEPRRHLALLRELVARDRATPPPLRYNLFDAAALPTDCFNHILKFWRSDDGEQSTPEVLAAGAIPEETSDSDDDDWSTRYDKDPSDAADEPTEEELWQQEFEEEWEERWSDY